MAKRDGQTHRGRNPYNTRSNQVRPVKTPGGRTVYLVRKKKGTVPKCGDCGAPLNGLPALRPVEYSRIPKCQRTVARAYGGSRCGGCVSKRIIRAFLLEEQKLVKAIIAKGQKPEDK